MFSALTQFLSRNYDQQSNKKLPNKHSQQFFKL